MAADPSSVSGTAGTGDFKVATYDITEESELRKIQRMALNTPEGVDVTVGSAVTISRAIARPADTTAYTANDVWATSTSSPTVGGNLLDGIGRVNGSSGQITDITISAPVAPAILLQGELWIFDDLVTAGNDNAAFSLSDADLLKLVAIVPFTLQDTNSSAGNSAVHIQGLGIGFTCPAGADDLYFLVKVKNAYVPSSGETLMVRVKALRTS